MKSLIITDNQGFHHVSPKFTILPTIHRTKNLTEYLSNMTLPYYPVYLPDLYDSDQPSKRSGKKLFIFCMRVMSGCKTNFQVQETYVVSRTHYLLEHSTARQTPCLPRCKGTASHVRYECTQFTSRHHLLYSNLVPQHPVPLTSTVPNSRRRLPIPFSKTVQSILGNSFVFLSFFVDPWLTEVRIFHQGELLLWFIVIQN
jgi:hypothetical protein